MARPFVFLLVSVAGSLILGGCTGLPRPTPYAPDNELKPGPGLFSGPSGAFVIPVGPERGEAAHGAPAPARLNRSGNSAGEE